MADLYQVEDALRDHITTIVYPFGVTQASITGGTIRVYRGWPASIGLNADLANGIDTISIFSGSGDARDTTRYPRVWQDGPPVNQTMTVQIDGTQVQFAGLGNAGLIAGIEADGMAVTVAMSAVDTAETIASAFAALIPGAFAGGPSLEVAGAGSLSARIEAGGTATMETRRQQQAINITFWCATPGARDTLVAAVDSALSAVEWLQLPDGTAGHVTYGGTEETDNSENANLYRRSVIVLVDYPTIVTVTAPPLTFGTTTVHSANAGLSVEAIPAFPLLGAIRFDAWYDPDDTIDQQCANALSDPQWSSRLPPNAQTANGVASWPRATQATLDAEIASANLAGVDFFAFDSYRPGDGLSVALSLYLSSSIRHQVNFCMLGQSSNWSDPSTSTGYAASLTRDIALMTQAGYQRLANGRPLYLVLDASPAQLAKLPGNGIADALTMIRTASTAQGSGNPYIVWLSGAPLIEYDNIPPAIAAGADAAGAYACPVLNGVMQSFTDLNNQTEADWSTRAQRGFPMLPTGMAGWDQRPLIERPQPFYPIGPDLTLNSFYGSGTPAEIAGQIASMCGFISGHPDACRANIGLIYAWNELAEGGWVMPTFATTGPDNSRVMALAATVGRARREFAATGRTTL